MRIAICDDQKEILIEISKAVQAAMKQNGFENVEIFRFTESEELLSQYLKKPFDVLFLDIDMPTIDGITLGNRIRASHSECCLVYVSCQESRVFDAFSASPIWFVRKSTLRKDLENAVCMIKKQIENRNNENLVLTLQGRILSLPVKSILYVECWAKYQNIVSEAGAHEVRSTLRELEEKLLPFGFLKPHKGYLVNYRYIHSIEDNVLYLHNGTGIPVSKYRIKDIRNEYLRLMTKNAGF